MTRTLTITALERASAQDGTLWLVRDGDWPKACPLADPESCNGEHCDCRLGPPAEFVQACAPCETCHSTRRSSEWDVYDMRHNAPCPDCCIELVGSCPTCAGDTNDEFHPCAKSQRDGQHCNCSMEQDHCHWCGLEWLGDGEIDCPPCKNTKTVTLGYAYAVGQPLPIILGWQRPDGDSSGDVLSFWKWHYGPDLVMQRAWNATAIQTQNADRTAALAHYGPPEALIGKWALQLAVKS